MAVPPNVELEAAKFLQKLIQESKDEPTKLATKLYVILHHMRSSGKENSMPYQVISRAMETVISQHGLDINALASSRPSLATGIQVVESSSSQFGGSSLGDTVKEASKGLTSIESVKADFNASNRPPVGPSSGGHDIYQGSISYLNKKYFDHGSPSSFDTRSAKSQSEERCDSPKWEKAKQEDSNKGGRKRKRVDISSNSVSQLGNSQPPESSAFTSGMDEASTKNNQSRGISIPDGEHGQFNCMFQSSSMMGHDFMRAAHRAKQEVQHQAEKSLDSVNISNSLSRTPHSRHPKEIEVSSANNASIFQQEVSHTRSHDALDTRVIWYQNKTGSIIEKSRLPGSPFHASGGNSSAETSMHKSAGTADNVYGVEIGTPGPNAAAVPGHLGSVQFSSTYDNPILGPKVLKERNLKSSSSASPLELSSDKGAFGKALDYEGGSFHTLGHENITVQGSLLNNTTESTRKLPFFQSPSASVMPFKEQHLKQLRAQCLVYLALRNDLEPKKLHLDIALGSFLPKEDGPSMEMVGQEGEEQLIDGTSSTPDVQIDDTEIFHTSFSSSDGSRMVPDSALLNDNLLTVEVTEDASVASDLPPLPKYTTTEKWILDQQKRKLLTQRIWSLKLQRTQHRITAFSKMSKDSVSSSKDISAKTRSIIELKKLQLLELQSCLRNDILNDFFKPIASDMDCLKSIKKHRIGRKPKQLDKYEQKMKEERQNRFLERQKEFFSEIAIHKERLEDVFKLRRERWKGFNRSVKEFHKRKERVHREKIDRIQREKINLLKVNDVEGYLRMVQDAKSDRVKQLLKETEKYLQKLGSKLQDAKVMNRCFDTDIDNTRIAGVIEKNEVAIDNEDETDQAKHYLESNENYYLMAHSIKENVAEQPSCLVGGKLREYQMNGLRWLVSLYNNHLNGILADEMGLGKTVQVISLICYLMENKNDRGPFLVVVPSSVLPGWDSEINFWAPSINKIVYSGPPEERRRLFKERIVPQKFNVLLTTYEYLMNKHDRPKLSKIHWHYVIIDEGHRIKNASCKLNADLKLYHSSHRLLLTGTPLQNNLEELWALLNFLLPNIFNSSDDFSQWFNKPFESTGDSSPDEALLSEEENLLVINRLHQVLRPFVLRRLKHKVENELPEKIERLVKCEASAYQKLLMKRVEDNLGALGTAKARSVHNSVMELRNICNHPYLSQLHSEEVHDYIPKHYLPNMVRLCGKLEMLDRILPKLKATGHRVLLFSTMTRLLDVMEDYLYWKQYKYLRLDGHTSGGDRGALIDKFNKADSPYFIFLLSIRAGGVGVNLQAADTVIIFDTDWNPQVDLQAQARAHRIGQKREVLVLRFETVQTVEEQVRAAAEHKLGVANQSITAGFFDNNTSAEDRREYLESLLRESKKEEAAPVLHDDAVNNLIARSESEIDIYEAVDRRREEEEMAAWKSAIGEGTKSSEPVLTLPSRLVTVEELKEFCEAMKIYDAQTPAVVSNVGMKRKSGYVGGLDTQHYGRGKRAREVRSYEEQWTEDEFEQLCQVNSPHSPKMKDEVKEMNLPMISNNNFNIDVKAEIVVPSEQPTQTQLLQSAKPPPLQSAKPPPVQSIQPLFVKTTQQPLVFSEQSLSPHMTQSANPDVRAAESPDVQEAYSIVQEPLLQLAQQNKEIRPKQGRGRPKRATTQISPSKVVALSGAANMNAVSQIETAKSFGDVSPSSTVVEYNTGRSRQFSVSASPSFQAIASLPCASPSSQPNSVSSAVPVANKRRVRKSQSGGETPQGRGGKRSAVSSATSPSPRTDISSMASQGETVSDGPSTSVHATVSVVPHASDVGKEVSSQIVVPSVLPSSGTIKQQDAVVSSFSVLCSPSVTTEISARGIELHSLPTDSQQILPCHSLPTDSQQILPCHSLPTDSQLASVGNDNSSEQNLLLSSVSYVPPSQAVPKQVRRHGRKAQDESEAPQRRGRKASAASTAVLSGSGSQELTSTEPPQKISTESSGRATVTTRSKQENETDLDVSVTDGILLTEVEPHENTLDPAAIVGLVGDRCIVTKDVGVRHSNSSNECPGEKTDASVKSVIVPKDNRQEFVAERSYTQTDEAKPNENMDIVEEGIQHESIEEKGQIFRDTNITLAKTEEKSEENNVEQYQTQTEATGDEKIQVLDATELDRHEHKEGGPFHVNREVLAEVGQIEEVLDEQFQICEPVNLCEKFPGYQGAIDHDEREHEDKLLLAGADSAAEFKQTSESLIARSCKSQEIKDIDPLKEPPIKKCKYQTNEVSEHQKKVEVLHTDLQFTVGLEFEEPPTELCQAQSKEDPKHSENVEVLNIGEISTEAVQGLQKLSKEQLQTWGKEDSENCEESIEIPKETSCADMEQVDIGNHSNVEVTFEVEQILEEPSAQQCQTQEFEASGKVEFLNEQHQIQMEEVLEPSEIGKETSGETTCDRVEQGDQVLHDYVEVGRSLEEPSVQQCQTRLEKDVKASGIIVLSSEQHRTQAEETTDRTEQADKVLCDDEEVPVKVWHSLEEPSSKQSQTPIENDFEASKNFKLFEEAAKHESIEKQRGEASLSGVETEAEICQTTEELPGKQCRSRVEEFQTEETNSGRSNNVEEVAPIVEMDSQTNLIVDSGEENVAEVRNLG